MRKTERSKARQKPKKDKTSETKDRQESKFKGIKQTDLGGRKKTDIWTVNKTKDRWTKQPPTVQQTDSRK